MSRLNSRVVLSVLISLGVILAVFTTVQGASSNSVAEKMGAHSVSGVLTNFNHDRLTTTEQQSYQQELDSLNKSGTGSGHGCESEARNSPLD
jgi:hypothetical protein